MMFQFSDTAGRAVHRGRGVVWSQQKSPPFSQIFSAWLLALFVYFLWGATLHNNNTTRTTGEAQARAIHPAPRSPANAASIKAIVSETP